MKKILSTLMLLLSTTFAWSQVAQQGNFISQKTPQYMASGTSNRIPVVFEAKVLGLFPNSKYYYYVKAMAASDFGTTSHGVGNTLIVGKDGNWKQISTGSFTGSNYDSFTTDPGGEFQGYFGISQTGNSRFNSGSFVYPVIVLQHVLSSNKSAAYLDDSIKCLAFGTGMSEGTGVYGNSYAKPKDIIMLYDKSSTLNARPISMTYVEKCGMTITNPVSFYSSNVSNSDGAWGTILPNDLSNGIITIERFNYKTGGYLYTNSSSNGIWDGVSTKNPKGGTTALKISALSAPLEKATVEFDIQTQKIVEGDKKINVNVTISARYADTSIVAITYGGAATDLIDYKAKIDTLTFLKTGPSTLVYSFDILDDFLQEKLENVSLKINAIKNTAVGAFSGHTVLIEDNDTAFIGFDKATETILEESGSFNIPVKIFNGSSLSSNVRLYVKSFSGGTIIPQEFSLGVTDKDSFFSIPANILDSVLPIKSNVFDDALIEADDTIIFGFKDISGLTLGKDSIFTLIIKDDDHPQTFNFTESSKTMQEKDGGKYKIYVHRTDYTSKLSDVKVRYISSSSAKESIDYKYSPQSKILNFSKTSGDSLFAEVEILNDDDFEMNEEIVFVLESLSNSTIGSMDTFKITIVSEDMPIYDLSTISTLDVNGVADSLNVKCRITGIVYGRNLHPYPNGNEGLLFTVNDNQGGIKIFSPMGNYGYNVSQGDSVMVQGVITQTNGELMMTNIDTIRVIKAPVTLSLVKSVTELVESDESFLVKFDKVILKDKSQWPTTMGNNQVKDLIIITEKGEMTLRIDGDTDVDDLVAPSGYFSLTGIVGQSDNSSPYTSNYHIIPRKKSDVANIVVPMVSFKNATINANEKNTTVDVILEVSNSNANVSVKVIDNGAGTASKPADYTFASPSTIDIKTGELTKTLTVNLADEIIKDGTKTIILDLEANFGAELGTVKSTTITIVDNETSLKLPKWLNSISPNPATDYVKVNANTSINKITITDVNGKKVLDFNNLKSLNNMLDISALTSGVYWLNVQSDKGIAFVKIIKQ